MGVDNFGIFDGSKFDFDPKALPLNQQQGGVCPNPPHNHGSVYLQ